MVVETDLDHARPWGEPDDSNASDVLALRSSSKLAHPGGWNVCFFDGSVHFFKSSISAETLRRSVSIRAEDAVDPASW